MGMYVDEWVKGEYKEKGEIEWKGLCEGVSIGEFGMGDKGVEVIVRRGKWYEKENKG